MNEGDIEQQTDVQLVEQRETFGELFRRHHAKAYGWVKTLTPDTYAAEDIVQEALMKAFLHLGTLFSKSIFLTS